MLQQDDHSFRSFRQNVTWAFREGIRSDGFFCSNLHQQRTVWPEKFGIFEIPLIEEKKNYFDTPCIKKRLEKWSNCLEKCLHWHYFVNLEIYAVLKRWFIWLFFCNTFEFWMGDFLIKKITASNVRLSHRSKLFKYCSNHFSSNSTLLESAHLETLTEKLKNRITPIEMTKFFIILSRLVSMFHLHMTKD